MHYLCNEIQGKVIIDNWLMIRYTTVYFSAG